MMQTIQMNCRRCGAPLVTERRHNQSVAACPYCRQDVRLLVESDRVMVAQLRAETQRTILDHQFAREYEKADRAHTLFLFRIGIISATAFAVLVLLFFFLNG